MKWEISRNCSQHKRMHFASCPNSFHQQVPQLDGHSRFLVALGKDVLIDETLLRDRARKTDKIFIDCLRLENNGIRKAKQRRTNVRQKYFKRHPANGDGFHCTLQKDVLCKRLNTGYPKHFFILDGQGPFRFRPFYASDNHRIL